jgi:hypothetical protein
MICQENKGDTLGYIQEHGEITQLLPPRPEDIDSAGITVTVVRDFSAEEPAADEDGKRNSGESKGSYSQQSGIYSRPETIP